MKDDKQFYVTTGALLLAVWLFYRNAKLKAGDGEKAGLPADLPSGNPATEAQNIANTIKQVFANAWYLDSDDYAAIMNACKLIKDRNGATMVFRSFGSLSTYLYGSGDLDYWMQRLPESVQDSCRPWFYGISQF